MCDILTMECEWCGQKIDTHLGDFSVGRQQVKVFCHRDDCQQAALKYLAGYRREYGSETFKQTNKWGNSPVSFAQPHMVFPAPVTMNDGSIVPVLYVVDWPREINTNGDDEGVFLDSA